MPVSMLMRDDLPTLLLPMKAYSGLSGFGQALWSGLLIIYDALVKIMVKIRFIKALRTLEPNLINFVIMGKFAHDTIVPDVASNLSKKEQVALMFNRIAPQYDFLNRFLSAGIDISWRKKALSYLKKDNPQAILDVATGTADVAMLAAKILQPKNIIGIDISEGMLELGRIKIAEAGLKNIIELQTGDSEEIKFEDNTFDAVTVSFGVRNFQHLEKGLQEINRVLNPGGKLVVLEFSRPSLPGIQQIYNLYMSVVAPGMGKLFSKNGEAYQYLNNSVQKFPEGKDFIKILESVGFKNTSFKRLSLGICSIYIGEK
jgi:demethylmenaquinone methyltransferase/2-methoxy-6-polyprenyl-1,4-benzoquinol methylase